MFPLLPSARFLVWVTVWVSRFLQVHRVKTPSKLVESENIFLAYAGRWLIESQPCAKTAPQ